MRRPLSVLLTLSLFAVSAHAGTDAIKLDNQKTIGQSIYGTCGSATVSITGAEKDSPADSTGFSGLYSAITIQSGKSSLKISPDPDSGSTIFLQDRNKLYCVSTPKGRKLILALICYGRSCAPVDYRVIDPGTATVINKLDNMDECDAACAQKALGAPLPQSLRP